MSFRDTKHRRALANLHENGRKMVHLHAEWWLSACSQGHENVFRCNNTMNYDLSTASLANQHKFLILNSWNVSCMSRKSFHLCFTECMYKKENFTHVSQRVYKEGIQSQCTVLPVQTGGVRSNGNWRQLRLLATADIFSCWLDRESVISILIGCSEKLSAVENIFLDEKRKKR